MATPSARTQRGCPHAPACVGCPLIGTPYGGQLRAKVARVAAAVAAYPRLSGLAVPPVIGSPRLFGYRNQAKLVVRRSRRGLLLGVYRPGTHEVVDISECPVHDPRITDVLRGVRAASEALSAPVYDERDGSGWLRYVVVRTSAWRRAAEVILVVRGRAWPGERELVKRLRRLRGVASVVLNVNASPGNAIFGPTFISSPVDGALYERIGAVTLRSRAGAFLQANIGVARRVYQCALRFADPGPDDIAVDLYCGVGAISLMLAGRAKFVLGVEESARAVLDAKRNIRLNGYHNVRFTAAQADEGLAQAAAMFDRIDVVVVNPPRKGLDAVTRAAIGSAAPRRIVYVSCDPDTLARDLDRFAEHGWRITAVQPFDMLPQTEHVECVALLESGGAGEDRDDRRLGDAARSAEATDRRGNGEGSRRTIDA
ncbi:MAG: 23S rRNA (uracil(1939)-C(5))-methyltransferase RlmD [Candidatus Binatia bacterium]